MRKNLTLQELAAAKKAEVEKLTKNPFTVEWFDKMEKIDKQKNETKA